MAAQQSLPIVSVILPAYNEEKYISSSLTSLLNQTYPKDFLEIILVDNGSSDRTVEIAQSHGINVILEPQGPVGNVRNTGVKHSKGEIICFLDADCIAPANWVENGVDFLSKNIGNVVGGGLRLRKSPYFLEKYWLLTTNEGEMLPSELLGSTIIIGRETFFKVGMFSIAVTAGEDSAFHRALISQGYNVVIDRNFSVVHLGNAVDVKSFVKRQIWHSENYIRNIQSSVVDPVFWITLIFLFSLVSSILSLVRGTESFFLFALLTVLSVALRSVKRVLTTNRLYFVWRFPQVFFLDFLYLCGRSLGVMKGIKEALKS